MNWLDKWLGAEKPSQPSFSIEGKPAYLGKPQDTPERVRARLEQLREAAKDATGEKLAELVAETERLEAHARHCAQKFSEIVAESEHLEAVLAAKEKPGKGKGKKGK